MNKRNDMYESMLTKIDEQDDFGDTHKRNKLPKIPLPNIVVEQQEDEEVVVESSRKSVASAQS